MPAQPQRSYTVDGEIRHTYQLADPDVQLDLTSDPWNIKNDSASVVVGRNILHPGVLGPEGGRFPVGCSVPSEDRPIVSAHGLEFKDPVLIRHRDFFSEKQAGSWDDRYAIGTADIDGDGADDANTVKKLTVPYAWPDDVVGATFAENEDGREGTIKRATIVDVVTITNANDTIRIRPLAAISTPSDEAVKYTIVYRSAKDKRGILMSNGRKFWLVQGGATSLVLDLGSDDLLGQVWDAARIHPHVILLVNAKYPPRVLRLDAATGITTVSGNETLAGCIAPTLPEFEEFPGDVVGTTWSMKRTGSAGSITGLTTESGTVEAAKCRIRVRAVNLEDDVHSEFVQVYAEGSTDDFLAVVDSDAVSVFQKPEPAGTGRQSEWPCGYHPRWTHIEIWRTTALGVDYFLEKRISIIEQLNEEATGSDGNDVLVEEAKDECTLSDADLSGLTLMSSADRSSGRLPPMCRKVVSLAGVTICGGKADPNPVKPSLDGIAFQNSALDWIAASGTIHEDGTGPFTAYAHRSGDRYVIRDYSSANIPIGTIAILSKVSADAITIDSNFGGTILNGLHGHILRSFEIDWPTIDSDEELWFSRTDVFAPESFVKAVLRVSQIGDTLMDLVNVGRYVAAIYRSGVHLIYHTGAALFRNTVGFNQGTPWENSVVATENVVFWAHPDGIKVMKVFQDNNIDGNLGEISDFATPLTRAWFREAFDNGWDIDGGMDELNGCVRWRRKESTNKYETLQYGIRTKKFTVLDDDNGLAYVRSANAESAELTVSHLYSVDSSGAAFRVNYQDTADAYPGATVQDTLGSAYTFTGVRIFKAGAFLATMLGETIRFYSDNASVNEVGRVITTAGANEIRFDDVPGLAAGDEFVIGAVRFKIRFPVMLGAAASDVKTIEGIRVHALPGPRNTDGDWPATPTGQLTARVYANYEATAFSEKPREIDIFPDEASGKTTADRISTVEGQGRAIELEIEHVGARSDLRIELVEVGLREETTQIGDAT